MADTSVDVDADTTSEIEELWFGDKVYNRMVRLGRRTAVGTKDWKRKRALSALEVDLFKIMTTANSHLAKGKPKGAPVYLELEKQAHSKITTFCEKYQVDPSVIETEAPALADLHALTIPDQPLSSVIKLVLGIGGSITLLILIGLASGIVAAVYHWVLRTF